MGDSMFSINRLLPFVGCAVLFAAYQPSAGVAAPAADDGRLEVQVEYLDGRFFKDRNINLSNVHVYREYRKVKAVSLHYGMTVSHATGTCQDVTDGESRAWGAGPSYMIRWERELSHGWSASLDATGSMLLYSRTHPADGRRYGFLWRIGPRLSYHFNASDALGVSYIFHHASNGHRTHNPGYNGIGFALGWQRRM